MKATTWGKNSFPKIFSVQRPNIFFKPYLENSNTCITQVVRISDGLAVSYYIFLLITPLPSYHNLPTTYHCSNGSHCISWWLGSLTQFVENSQPAQSFNMVTIIVLSWRKGLLSNLLLSNYATLS